MFIHFFCLCPLGLTIKLNFDTSKVAYLNMAYLHYNVIQHECETISGNSVVTARMPGIASQRCFCNDANIKGKNNHEKRSSDKVCFLYTSIEQKRQQAKIIPTN